MRNEWEFLAHELIKMEDVYLEINRLRNISNNFYNLTIERKNQKKMILNLFEAKSCFESCVTLLKSLIEPRDNEFIERDNQDGFNFDKIREFFDNFFSILDSEGKELKTFIQHSDDKIVSNFTTNIFVKSYREKLMNYFEDLVLFPLFNTLKLCKEKDLFNKKIKDSNGDIIKVEPIKIFEYTLYRQVLISAKIKGSPTRQKTVASSSSLSSTFHETNIIKQNKKPTQQNRQIEIPNEIDEWEDII